MTRSLLFGDGGKGAGRATEKRRRRVLFQIEAALEIEDQPVPRDAVLVAAFVFHEQGAEIDVRNARHRLSQRDGEAVMAHVQVFVVVVNDIEIAVAEVVHGQGHETVPGVEIGLGHGADRFQA